MDADSNDGTVTESLNGETKPDPAKLAQTAIIKQDVMLSATSTQSPLATISSVFTMPAVSMPNVSLAGSLAGSAICGLPEQLFMSVPGLTDAVDAKHESNGLLSSALASQSQLFGQPQVAPQYFLAGQSLQGPAGTAQMPVQQLLIPVTTANGTQQFISIPVSLATGGNQQIQLLTTSNGQILATNLASAASSLASIQGLSQPINMSLANSGLRNGPINMSLSNTVSTASNHHASNSLNSSHHTASPSLANQLPSIPHLLAGSPGQLLMGSQILSSISSAAQGHSTSSAPQSAASLPTPAQHAATNQAISNGSSANSVPAISSPQVASHPTLTQAAQPHNSAAITAQSILTRMPQSQPTSEPLPLSISQLLPNTVSNSTESTTVDGINLDEIKDFAKQFKIRRLSLGLTQTQVGQALSSTEGPAYSQSAICRFEKLDITPKSAQKIKPVLERWMLEAEERYKNGLNNLTDFIGSEPSKKRKRRTSFTPQALEVLNQHFERNTHPSGSEMTELSDKLRYDRELQTPKNHWLVSSDTNSSGSNLGWNITTGDQDLLPR